MYARSLKWQRRGHRSPSSTPNESSNPLYPRPAVSVILGRNPGDVARAPGREGLPPPAVRNEGAASVGAGRRRPLGRAADIHEEGHGGKGRRAGDRHQYLGAMGELNSRGAGGCASRGYARAAPREARGSGQGFRPRS